MPAIRVYRYNELIGEIELVAGGEYTLGRAADCSLMLEDSTLSRRHLRVFFTGQNWRIECLSRFIPLKTADSESYEGFDLTPDLKEVWLGEFRIVIELMGAEQTSTGQLAATELLPEDLAAGSEHQTPSNQPHTFQDDDRGNAEKPDGFISKSSELGGPEPFDDPFASTNSASDEGTQIVNPQNHDISHLEPYVRVVYPSGAPDDILKLEGTEWTAGRDSDCEIALDYTKVSREHFVISKISNEYFVTDLNSSNGTVLNGEQVSPGQRVPLDSGDKIQIKDLKIYFEIRDSRFQKQLQILQTDQNIGVHQTQYLPGPAGAVRIPPPQSRTKGKNAKFIRLLAIVTIVGAVAVSLFESEEMETSSHSTVPADGFEALTSEQRTYLESTYNLAERLYTDSKYELVLTETRKIHELVPAFKDSKRLETFSLNAIENLRQQEEMRKAEEAQRLLAQKVDEVMRRCEGKFSNSTDVAGARACVSAALELDPENKRALELTTSVEIRLDQFRLSQQRNRELNAKIQRGIASYEKARSLHDQGALLDALEAYNNHLKSSLPDPKNLKEQSQRSISSIRKQISTQIEEMYQNAKNAHDSGDYKTSILTIRKIVGLDESHKKSVELLEQSEKELNKKARALYEDSILEESLGNIQTAKERWKKIIEIDVQGGDYFTKASAKIKKYGQ